ncbi:hypothetical protein BDW02DRAFT_569931 [Decorospora gaudefroyi]|uniref:F-box domain-containing protein n=1 Tax=Decorospora gaudefroyi TaxID=184978 RepID=A0A6A5KAC4_9PLEO|nr:hypothetical protein BDW02DRAFT_569931 [Decorospora gaudefroyi]
MATQPGLTDLPNELLIQIIEYIPNENCQDISSLSRTSRRMYTLALDHLYTSFSVTSPWLLLRTLLLKPELGKQVRKVSWKHNEVRQDHNEHYKAVLASCMRNFKLPELSEAVASGAQSPIERLYHEFLAMFLLSTPNVKTVILEPFAWQDGLYWFKTIASHAERLPHLRTIYIHGPLRLEQTAHIFLLPSVRNITLTDLVLLHDPANIPDDEYTEWDNSETPLYTVLQPGTSRVEALTLKRSCIEVPILTRFTNACTTLTRFEYEHDIHNAQSRDLTLLNLLRNAALEVALARHRKSLHHLSIRGDHQMMYQRHMLHVARLASRMQNLCSLDMGLLTNDEDPVYGASEFVAQFLSHLPPTLQELSFEIDWQEHWGAKGWEGPTEFLRLLAAVAPARLGLLNRVAVVDWPPVLGLFPPDFADLYGCFGEGGLRFVSVPALVEGPSPVLWVDDVEPGWVFVEVGVAELE